MLRFIFFVQFALAFLVVVLVGPKYLGDVSIGAIDDELSES